MRPAIGDLIVAVDLIEQGACLQVLPALKTDALQNARHPRFDVDGLDRLHVADEFARAGLYLSSRPWRRWCRAE